MMSFVSSQSDKQTAKMYRSIFIFVLLALSTMAITQETVEEKKDAEMQKCINETGVNHEEIQALMNLIDSEITEDLKCFFAYLLKFCRPHNANESFNVPNAVSKIPADTPRRQEIVNYINGCAVIRGENDCHTTDIMIKCLRENREALRGQQG